MKQPTSKSTKATSEFYVGASLRHTYRFIYQKMQERLAPHDISMGMFYFFMWLWREDGLTQKELGDRVGTLGPGTVEQLRRMEARGFIKRTPSKIDRRKIHVFLTPKGRALKKQIVPIAQEVNDSALQGIGPAEVKVLRACLWQIRQNFRASRPVHGKATARDPDKAA
ncbi:MarR family winged helix-turn-helix transcriptional regulator [Undibacter mobilis]|uniref:MarR family winged helix-turn-helix transcriptional regulator n=1 Tax=Undibacter mobilis TaxID=2292256 RepID=UPI0011C06C66|nr:MarR family winged helix-turn-helix transcriptional regulator [Undibacter mobilis]